MNLVDQNDFAKATKLDKIGLGKLAGTVMNILKISDVNQVYDKFKDHKGVDFIDHLFKEFEVDFEFFEEELARIPKTGPFITISNHPLGGVDGILLIKLVSMVRPDFKVMANFLLKKVEPISEFIMPVNPFETGVNKSSIPGIKEALVHIKEGKPLGIFPAGEVSTYNFDEKKIVDKAWETGAIKFIQKAQVPVVPIYFKAKNSFWFYFLSSIHPALRTAKLPSELFNKHKDPIHIRIGKPIMPSELQDYSEIQNLSNYLRTKTYMLMKALPPKKRDLKIVIPKLKPQKPVADIAPETDKSLILKEIELIRESGCRLSEVKNYELFLARKPKINHIVREIGRLRELTFREVGEGSNLALDLDEFDEYYHHLLLWDKDAELICGAYRLGLGNKIFEERGLQGFYVPSLFKIAEPAEKLFKEGIELGRAFVIKSYQGKPLPLFLLWKGIVHAVLRNPGHRYLTGCVSISNHYSKFSKSLIIEFVRRFYYDTEMYPHVIPRKKYKVELDEADSSFIFNISKSDLNRFDKFIEDLEPGNVRIPVLLKKYIKQNAKIVAFNVDPKFNNCVDGFMYIDIKDLPEQTMKPVLEELEAEQKKMT